MKLTEKQINKQKKIYIEYKNSTNTITNRITEIFKVICKCFNQKSKSCGWSFYDEECESKAMSLDYETIEWELYGVISKYMNNDIYMYDYGFPTKFLTMSNKEITKYINNENNNSMLELKRSALNKLTSEEKRVLCLNISQ